MLATPSVVELVSWRAHVHIVKATKANTLPGEERESTTTSFDGLISLGGSRDSISDGGSRSSLYLHRYCGQEQRGFLWPDWRKHRKADCGPIHLPHQTEENNRGESIGIFASEMSNHGFEGQVNACWTHKVTRKELESILSGGFLMSIIHGRFMLKNLNPANRNDVIAQIGHARSKRKHLHSELWHACAGPLVSLPRVGSLVYYFPQGHSEQVAVSTKCSTTSQVPNYPNLPSQLMCQVHNVTLHADTDTNEIFAQMSLQPIKSA
ncbi:LOW QUALITY PROTEIN: hypothetical protein V2J09_016895 [Rumex salicifolius]